MMIMDVRANPTLQPARHKEMLKTEVADLRQRLLALGVWPEAGDQFLAMLPGSRWHSPPLIEEDKQWLLTVAQAALKGQDIGANYPAFFQKLITNAGLRQAFMEELDRLWVNNNGVLTQ